MAKFKLVNPISGGGASFVTQFTPDLTANGANLLDNKLWIFIHGVSNPATTDFFAPDVVNTPPLQFRMARVGGTGNAPNPAYFYPRLLLNPSVMGVRQFAQARIISKAGGTSETGPAVMCCGDPAFDQGAPWPVTAGHNGYVAATQAGNDTTIRIRRASITSTILSTIAGWALNDLCLVRVTPSAPSNLVETFRNGVLVDSFADANAVRPGIGTGWPCFAAVNLSIPTATECRWTDLSFGIF